MSILPKVIYRFSEIPTMIPMVYFTGLEQIIPKTYMVPKLIPITTAILRRENKVGAIALLDIKLYYKAIVSKQHGTGIKTHI